MAKSFHDELDELFTIQPADTAKQNINTAMQSGLNPDEEGGLRDSSQQTGIRADVLRGQQALLIAREREKAEVAKLDQRKHVAEWMAESPHNALLSHDDIYQLEKLATVARGMRAEPEPRAIRYW